MRKLLFVLAVFLAIGLGSLAGLVAAKRTVAARHTGTLRTSYPAPEHVVHVKVQP
jgi:hypothetical protein